MRPNLWENIVTRLFTKPATITNLVVPDVIAINSKIVAFIFTTNKMTVA